MLLLASCADNHSPVAGTFVAAYPISSEAEHGPRPATLVGGYTESCPFPKEADFANIDDGTAYLQIVVAADGTTKSVSILRDSGYGFGAAAQACASSFQYRPALDANGAPVQATLKTRIHFSRDAPGSHP